METLSQFTEYRYVSVLIEKALELKLGISPQYVQNMLFIVNGIHIALYDKPLVLSYFKTSDYGAVIQDLDNMLVLNAPEMVIKKGSFNARGIACDPFPLNSKEKALFDKLFQVYGRFTEIEIESFIKRKDSPWFKTYWNKGAGKIIKPFLIKEYYKERVIQRI